MSAIITARPGRTRINQYLGRCQCGAVRYAVELDARSDGAQWGFSVWECVVAPTKFELLAGADQLRGHQFAPHSAHHFCCQRCGSHSFSHHAGSPCGEFYSVDMRDLDACMRSVVA